MNKMQLEELKKHITKIKSFNDIYKITKKLTNKAKGDLFEKITYALFKHDPKLNIGLTDIWMYDDVPKNIRETLKLPEKDKGIDLLAKIKEKYYAIQCKFRQDPDVCLGWKEVSTFYGLSFGMTDIIKSGFLVTNATDLCKEVIKSEKVVTLYSDYFETIPQEIFENMRNEFLNLKFVTYVLKNWLSYQEESVKRCVDYLLSVAEEKPETTETVSEDVIIEEENDGGCEEIEQQEHEETNDGLIEIKPEDSDIVSDDKEEQIGNNIDYTRCHIEMACGTGKSLVAYWIDKELTKALYELSVLSGEPKQTKTLILLPSLYLLSQMYADHVNQAYAEQVKVSYLLIGSDVDTDDEVKYKANGIKLCTNPAEIRSYIDNVTEKLVVICTYQSSDKLAIACNKEISFDFGIFDEAHKTVGQVGKQFSMMLTNDSLVIDRRLFMTATPKFYGKNSKEDDEDIISMDNETYYGKKIYSYNTGNAIADGRLVDYQLVTILATDKDIEDSISKNKLLNFKDQFTDKEANYLGSILILLKKIHDGTCNHMITYHNTVDRAIKFRDFLIKINDILYKDKKVFIDSLDGSVSMAKRKKIVREYVGSKLGILCSARVLNEGVNIPIVDGVCFVDARFSTIDIVQCIGRALRLSEGKKMAYVFIPTFIKDINDEFNRNIYGNIISILKALKSTDDTVTDYFTLKDDNKKCARKLMATEHYPVVNIGKNIDLDVWNKDICTKLWEIIDPFENMYQQLVKWIDENDALGRLPNKQSKDIHEKKLGSWCSHKRQEKRLRILNDTRIKKMELIKYWYWELDPFYEMYQKVKQWIDENDRMPGSKSKDEYEKKLGMWCCDKRKYKKRGKLTNYVIDKMEQLTYWYWNEHVINKTETFDTIYDRIKLWINANDRIPSKHSENDEEKKLGHWCSGKRKYKKQGKLKDTVIAQLEKLKHWFWEIDDPFEEMYEKVKQWIDTNDKLPSSKSKNIDEKKLGQWCGDRKKNKKQNKLDADIIKKLEKLKYWYWSKDVIIKPESFDDVYNKLKQFIETNNKLPSKSSKNDDEKRLGHWCVERRKSKKQNKLDDDKIKKLEQLPGWYWTS